MYNVLSCNEQGIRARVEGCVTKIWLFFFLFGVPTYFHRRIIILLYYIECSVINSSLYCELLYTYHIVANGYIMVKILLPTFKDYNCQMT